MVRGPLTRRGLAGRLDEDPRVAVRVDIDEPRGHVLPRRVDVHVRPGAVQAADLGDPPTADPEVPTNPRRPRAVEDAAPADDHVEGHRGAARTLGDLIPPARPPRPEV